MTGPTIHKNGTARWQLADQYTEAASAVRKAIVKNKAAAPNPRDYYTQGPDAYSQALHECTARHTLLVKILDEFEEIQQLIADADDE
jgi:hypothetical protein